jgi:hypothetical protein
MAHLAQEALAEEENDANAAVSLLLKRQDEAESVAVQEGKAGQGAAQTRNTSSAGAVGIWGRRTKERERGYQEKS